MGEDGNLRAALVREAVALLRDGTGAVSLRAVARGAGVSAMAPYRHFAEKAALLGAVAEQGFTDLRVALEAADARASGGAALVEQGLAYIAFARRQPQLFRLMFAGKEIASAAKEPGETAYTVLARRVAALAPAAAAPGALACWALVHGLATLTLDERIEPDDTQVRA